MFELQWLLFHWANMKRRRVVEAWQGISVLKKNKRVRPFALVAWGFEFGVASSAGKP
jgi:hypothetical protein